MVRRGGRARILAAGVLALAGCGRFGFDGAPAGDARADDAPGGDADGDANVEVPCTFVVDTTSDDPALTCTGSGCSLPGALAVASAGAKICLNGELVEITSELVVERPVIVSGPGTVRRGGAGIHRLLNVMAGAELVLEDLVLTRGAIVDQGGGGILVNAFASVRLDGVTMTDNNADATTLSVDGGAIYVRPEGRLEVRRSTFEDNGVFGNMTTSARGGAIAIEPGQPVIIEDSTFNANQASSFGGALFIHTDGAMFTARRNLFVGNRAIGGAVADVTCSTTGTIAFESSTFTDNQAMQSVILVCSTTTVAFESCTFAGNTAPLVDFDGQGGAGAAVFARSILASGANNICVGTGTGTSMGNNLRDGGDGVCAFTAPGDATGDPLLAPLANNGGPTQTMLPSPSSPAIDLGGTGCPTRDQRGVTRPQRSACDIGAVEVE